MQLLYRRHDILSGYDTDFFTTTALNNGSITVKNQNNSTKIVQYFKNGNWYILQLAENGTSSVAISKDESILWKGYTYGLTFGSTVQYTVSGNVLSLRFGSRHEYGANKEIFNLNKLFLNSTLLVSAEDLRLPTTRFSIGERSSGGNFYGSSQTGYQEMFKGCTSLLYAPKVLYAVEVGEQGYQSMFEGCTSLIKAPRIMATVLWQRSMRNMFYGCSALEEGPEMQRITLIKNQSLYTNSGTFEYMYYDCRNLRKIYLADPPSEDFGNKLWVAGVAASGTMINLTRISADDLEYSRGYSWGIPNGWTIETPE